MKRTTKVSAIELLEKKHEEKAKIRREELEVRTMELDLQRKKWDMEEQERNARLEMDIEQRRLFMDLLKKHVNN